jgi:hypothetical protein
VKNRLSSDPEFPACGYGLSGLCCSACLFGPCRISPFDRDTDRGECKASADRLVAGNLLRMIAGETAGRLAELARSVNQIRAASSKRPAVSSANPGIANEIFDKYGLDRAAAGKTGNAGLLAGKIEDLLSVDHPARDLTPVWSRLYPESVFPQFYSGEILPTDSLTLTGLAAFQLFQKQDAARKDILRACLKVSLVYLVCEELIQDLDILQDKETVRAIKKNEPNAAETLDPAQPSARVILMHAADQSINGLEGKTEAFRKQWPGPLMEILRPAGLFDIGRQFYRRWSRPVADTEALVVVLTASAALVAGILACGYAAVSWPGLPLSGSDPVRRFFSEDLKQVFGSVYLPPEAGDILSVAQNYFRKVP